MELTRNLVLAAALAATLPASAGAIHGLTTDNRLVAFDRTHPDLLLKDLPITGLIGGDSLLGIDFRPATGELWGISATRLYTINPNSGVATDQTGGTPFSITGSAIGFDFNPVVDRIRVVGIDDQDLRLNPLTGGLAFTDGSLTYNDGSDIRATASAYLNNFDGTLVTTLFNIDAGPAGFNLTVQSPPNSGINTLIAAITGLDTPPDPDDWLVGFDIEGSQSFGYLSLAQDSVSSHLYRIDLATGAATLAGEIGADTSIRDLAVPVPEGGALLPSAALLGGVAWMVRRRRPAVTG